MVVALPRAYPTDTTWHKGQQLGGNPRLAMAPPSPAAACRHSPRPSPCRLPEPKRSRDSGEAVLAELVPEAALADAEQASGAGLHVLRLAERPEDHLPLEPIEPLVEPHGRRPVLL